MAESPSEKRREPTKSEESIKPTVIMSEIDARIHERMRSQPKDVDDIDVKVIDNDTSGLHRLSLPIEIEMHSYDCTRGWECKFHKKEKVKLNGVQHVKTLNHGKYAFRWLLKNDRSIDDALNVKGWYLVNRGNFPGVPRHLFSVSGGVELGDSILAFMPYEKAEQIRNAPGRKSRELLRSRMTPSKKRPDRVLMSGNPDSEHIYEPDMGKEAAETGDGSSSQTGSLEEGRDF